MKLGNRGVLQGSVLSHFLFNVAMIGLPKILKRTEGLQRSFYAGDITPWVSGGSHGRIKNELQRAIKAAKDHVSPCPCTTTGNQSSQRLCKPSQSQLLSARIRAFTISANQLKAAHRCDTSRSPTLHWWWNTMHPHTIRVLGRHIQANGHNSKTVLARKKKIRIKSLDSSRELQTAITA